VGKISEFPLVGDLTESSVVWFGVKSFERFNISSSSESRNAFIPIVSSQELVSRF
jgi:hypothetical protein